MYIIFHPPPLPFFCFFDDDEKELAQGFRTVRKEKTI
jgi:hypothetical protein